MASIFDKVWRWVWNTETKYYDGEITRDTDWGGDESTENQPVSGGRVQEWLKNEINGKFGVARMSQLDTDTNFYSIELFVSKEEEERYDEADDKDAVKDLVTRLTIPISAVQGDSYSARLYADIEQNNIVVSGSDFKVPFRFSSIRYSQGVAEDAGARGTLYIQVSTDNGSTWSDVATLRNELQSRPSTNTDFNKDDVLNIGGYLKDGRQLVRVRASFEYEDIATGDLRTAYSSWVTIGASVTKTNLELTLTTNYYTPMYPTDTNGNPANFSVSYQTAGSVNKVLHLEITSSGGTNTVTRNLTPSDNQYVVSLSDASYLTHGVKKVKAWMTCEDGLGNTITSNVLVNRFMMVADANDTKPYLLLQNIEAGEEIDNFVQTEIAEYAVYSKSEDNVNITFLLTSYAQGTDAWTTEYFRMDAVVKPNTANKLLTTVEIEAVNDAEAQPTYTTYFRVLRGYEDFMYASTGERFYKVDVDNTNAMTPITGATFLLNPKVRNNNEENPLLILNAKDNNKVVDAKWTNADLINGMWITDDQGNKVLRIMAGTKLEIIRDIWAAFRKDGSSSMTFEIDCKISNVTNTTDPIIQAFSGTASSFRGLKMNTLEGWLMNGSEQSKDDCLFAWQEDVRTHFSINLNSQVYPNKGDVQYSGTANPKGSIALARVLINGDCVRELKYDTSKTDEWTTSDSGSIIIGNEGADIDIYSIRIYENKDNRLDMVDIMRRNRLAALPTIEEKEAYRKRNDLLNDKGLIDIEKVKNAGKNILVWHGVLPYKLNNASQTGWFEVFRYDEYGNYMPEYSGTLCKETGSLSIKGQGTTAKTYYDWNIQDDMSKVKATIQVAVRDFHESIHVRIEGDKAYIYGGNLGKNIPIETAANEEEYPYANGYVTVPDGWIDDNGKYRGKGYMVAPNTSLAQKKVLKINYASSMQSHLWGACNTYDELHRIIVGNTPIQELIPTAVSAKRTEPFMFFSTDGGDTYFRGMGNYGAGKADKVTWGYVKKLMPLYALIEGSDNNPVMTNFLVPFDKNTAQPHYDEDGEFDGWMYNGAISWDYDLGATGDDGLPTQEIFDKWADIHNFIYLHSTNLKYFVGTFEQFKKSKEAEDTKYKYWCTEDFILRRYDFENNQWVNAGLFFNGAYRTINLTNNVETSGAYNKWLTEGNGDYSKLNDAFISYIVYYMNRWLEYFINKKSLLFNYSYVLQFLAGTDNSAKNTYYKIDPIGVQMDSDSTFGSWFKVNYNKDFDYTSVHQLYFDGDDMDSIFRTDNNAHQTKPYYIERMYPASDENPNVSLYEGMNNQLFNFVERAYASDGTLADMMRQILNAAQNLVSQDDPMDVSVKSKISAWGFLHKYFFNVQRYFPEIAYLEQARIRYEFPELVGYISSGAGTRSIRPITQSLGSQLQNELQYMNQRLVYFASYASFGEFGSASGYTLGLEDAKATFGYEAALMPDGVTPSVHTYTIKSHQYIYPCYFDGSTFHNTGYRLSPNDPKGCTFTITENGGGDVGIGICGINYISDLGDLGDKSITGDLTINGKRLTRVYYPYRANAPLRPSSLQVRATNINYILFEVSKNTGIKFDASNLKRCVNFYLNGDMQITRFPESSALKIIQTPYYQKTIELKNVPNLSILAINQAQYIETVYIGSNVGTKTEFSSQSFAEKIYSDTIKYPDRPNTQSLHIENVNWTNFDVEALSWLADIPTCELKGTIAIKEDHPQGLPRVTWDLKNKFISKFGNVDSGAGGLILNYNQKPFNPDTARIKGNFYVEAGNTFKFEVKPGSIYENTQTGIFYYIAGGGSDYYMTTANGVLTVRNLQNTKKEDEVYAYVAYENKSAKISKTIEIWNRPAQVGDLVYADGTFSSKKSYDGEKTVVGRCFYVAPKKNGQVNTKLNDPNDKWLRMMVAADDVYVNNANSHQWGVYPLNSDEAHQNANSLFYLDDNDVRQNLSIDGVSIADIQTITNITSGGLTKQNEAGEWVDTSYIDDASFRDLTDEGYENDGFRMYAQNTAVGDGFGADTTGRVLDDALAKLAGGGYAKGDIVNSSYAKTLKVIHHRNGIISHVQESGEGINGLYPPLDFPTASGSKTELQHLGDLITAVREWAKGTGEGAPGETVNFNKWSQLLFPAASACYAYEPTNLMDGEVLNPKFKAHNWALPTDGILARLFWYTYDGKGYDTAATPKEGGVLDTVTNPNGKVVFKRITTSYLWSVTEYYSNYSWYVYFYNGYTSISFKGNSYVGRAVSAF